MQCTAERAHGPSYVARRQRRRRVSGSGLQARGDIISRVVAWFGVVHAARSAPTSPTATAIGVPALFEASAPLRLPLNGSAFGPGGYMARVLLGSRSVPLDFSIDSASATTLAACRACAECGPSWPTPFNCSDSDTCAVLACGHRQCPAECSEGGPCAGPRAGTRDPLQRLRYVQDDVALTGRPARRIPLSIGCAEDRSEDAWGAPVHGALALSGGRFSLLTAFRHSSPSTPNAYTFCLAPRGGEVVLGAREAGIPRDRASATARIRGGGVTSDNPLPALAFFGIAVGGDAEAAGARFAQTPARDKPSSSSREGEAQRHPVLPRPPRAVRVREDVPLDAPSVLTSAPGRPAALTTTWPHTVHALVDTASSLAHLPRAVVRDAADQLLDACRAASGDDGRCWAAAETVPALSTRGHRLAGAVSVPCVRVEGLGNASRDAAAGNGSACTGFDAGGFVPRLHLVAKEVTWTVPARQLAFASVPRPAGPRDGPLRCAQTVCLAATAAVPPSGDAVLGAATLQNFAVSVDHLTGTATFRVSRCTADAPPCPACGVMGTRWMPPAVTVLAVAASILAFAACFTFAVVLVARSGALASKRASVHRSTTVQMIETGRGAGAGLAGEAKDEDIESTFSSIRTQVEGVRLDRDSPGIYTDPPSATSQPQPQLDAEVKPGAVSPGGGDRVAGVEDAGRPLVVAHGGSAVVGDVDTTSVH